MPLLVDKNKNPTRVKREGYIGLSDDVILHSSCFTCLFPKLTGGLNLDLHWKIPHLSRGMFGWQRSAFLFFYFVCLFIYRDIPWDVTCILSVSHICDTDSGNGGTGGLCCAIIPVLGSEERDSQLCFTIHRKETNDKTAESSALSLGMCFCDFIVLRQCHIYKAACVKYLKYKFCK